MELNHLNGLQASIGGLSTSLELVIVLPLLLTSMFYPNCVSVVMLIENLPQVYTRLRKHELSTKRHISTSEFVFFSGRSPRIGGGGSRTSPATIPNQLLLICLCFIEKVHMYNKCVSSWRGPSSD